LGYNSVAVLCASTNSFFWNKYWTFQKRTPITSQEVVRFLILASATTLMNDSLLWLFGNCFPAIMQGSLLGATLLKGAAILGTMSVSFLGMRLWVFLQQHVLEESSALARASSSAWIEAVQTQRFPILQPASALPTVRLPCVVRSLRLVRAETESSDDATHGL